ncbi:DUF6542 domain-containing protein [Gordonia aurantiaca]|uniref:DUF6542 domain-containing protein n=1 Tax=Gordonia sp. B21 TaxID=3151852 RepID=UPI003266E239
MSSPQRLQTAVPLDQQSVLPAVRGVPWWGAVLLATGITALGAAIDAGSNDSLGGIYKFCYLVGCVLAALAVRRRALFTAAAQPPLIAFFVSIATLYGLNSEQASSGLKSLIFKVLLPIAADFPWMATVFVVTLVLVLARWYLTRDPAARTSPRSTKTGSNRAARPTRERTSRDRTDKVAPDAGDRGTVARRPRSGAAPSSKSAQSPKSAQSLKSAQSPKSASKPSRSATAKATGAGATERIRPPRTGGAPERPTASARTATAERPHPTNPADRPSTADRGGAQRPAAARPTVADLAAPELTPSDAPEAGAARGASPEPSSFPTYESSTDIADTRS